MKVKIRHILPHFPDRVYIQWGIEDPDPSRVEDVTFEIQRSGSPQGPWETRESNTSSVYYTDEYEDAHDDSEEEHLLSLSKQVWYRVVAHLENGDTLTSDPVNNFGTLPTIFKHVDGVGLVPEDNNNYPNPQNSFSPNPGMKKRLQMVQRVHQRNAIVNLQYFSGVYVAVLKRKKFGKRCPVCFDQASKTVTLSSCDTCYGTGWVGGYYSPIKCTAKINEAPLQSQIEKNGVTEIVQSQIELMDFPRLQEKDVIVELDSNRRWIVKRIGDRSLKRRRLTQQVTCRELSKTSSQYEVPVNKKSLRDVHHE